MARSFLIAALLVHVAVAAVSGMVLNPIVGGESEESPATPEVQAIADQIKSEAVAKLNGFDVTEWVVIGYSTQVVAGTLYNIKIQINSKDTIHVRVVQPFGNKPLELLGVDSNGEAVAAAGADATNGASAEGPIAGGVGEEQAADEETQKIADEVKPQVFAKSKGLASVSPMWKLISYKTQVVAGTMYSMKIQTDVNKFIHIQVFQPLGNGAPEVQDVNLAEEPAVAPEQESSVKEVPEPADFVGGLGGQLSAALPADAAIQEIADLPEIQSQVFSKLKGARHTMFKVISYKTQVVSGTMYYVKIEINPGVFIHVKIVRTISSAGPEVLAVQPNHTATDDIAFF